MILRLTSGETVLQELTVIVTGDATGDGKITVTDLLTVKAHLLDKEKITGCFAEASDINSDAGISITDFLKIKAHILNKEPITPTIQPQT